MSGEERSHNDSNLIDAVEVIEKGSKTNYHWIGFLARGRQDAAPAGSSRKMDAEAARQNAGKMSSDWRPRRP